MKKVSELESSELDYWVAKAEGYGTVFVNSAGCWIEKYSKKRNPAAPFSPSTDWSQGGPIIERERIEIYPYVEDECEQYWRAAILTDARPKYFSSPTPLIAAMRCYVASKFGENVDDSQAHIL